MFNPVGYYKNFQLSVSLFTLFINLLLDKFLFKTSMCRGCFKTLTIMTNRNCLSFVDINKIWLFVLSLVRYCFPLSSLHSICPVSMWFSKPSFLVTCSRNFNLLFLMLNSNFFSASTFSKISSLLTCSVHGIRSYNNHHWYQYKLMWRNHF